MNLEARQAAFAEKFTLWLGDYVRDCAANSFYARELLRSQEYSLLSGGKRFRPFVAQAVHQLFSADDGRIRSVCLALEMVHTYSLIHDDLPCMDNDDFRRGKPTNHKVFPEAIALLAGDGLVSDVFGLLAADPALAAGARLKIIRLFSEKIGSFGMVSGQVMDMQAGPDIGFEHLKTIHRLKTANLIETAAVAAGLAAEATEKELLLLSEFSRHLGMAFQIQDDVLDHSDKEQDFKSYVSVLGFDKASGELRRHSAAARAALLDLNKKSEVLENLIDYNLERKS